MRPAIGLGVASLLIIGGGLGLYALHRENQALHAEVERLSYLIAERPIELATFMATYEHFLDKLYRAGQARNWDLAAFYHHELEETAEQLEKLNLSDDGVPVSAMMRPNLIEPLEALEKAIAQKNPEAFYTALSKVVTQCNSCHAAAGKPYLRFSLPTAQAAPQQNFQP